MCTFITATINEGADLKALEPVFTRWCEGFKVFTHRAIEMQLPAERVYLLHKGHCDCGTEIGCGPTSYLAHIADKDLKKLEKKGWSEARIRRWQMEKLAAQERPKPKLLPDVDDWLELIREVLGTPTVNTFGLMHHFYSGKLEDNDFTIQVLPQKSIDEAQPSDLYTLRSDRLQEFVW